MEQDKQDKTRYSWRIWGAVWTATAGMLSIPEVQHVITVTLGGLVPVAYAPLLPAILGTIWPIVSKLKDPREFK